MNAPTPPKGTATPGTESGTESGTETGKAPVAVTIAPELFAQVESLAQRLEMEPGPLMELALTEFIHTYSAWGVHEAHHHGARAMQESSTEPRRQSIEQGDLYWVAVENPNVRKAGVLHPHVVIQDNTLNASRIETVVVCALTSNLRQVEMPGNVLLDAGEADLPRQSVVEVSKVSTVEKNQLGAYIGTLDAARVRQILAGMQFLQRAFFHRGQR